MKETNCVCLQCGKPFYCSDSDLRRGRGTWCSRQCNAISRKAPPNCTCKTCDKEFHAEAGELKRGRGVYCSHKCHSNALIVGEYLNSEGYLQRHANNEQGYELVHRAVAEEMLGHPLKPGCIVHHIDGDRTNNDPDNLSICADIKTHVMLHAQKRIIDAGGCPETDKICSSCNKLMNRACFPKCSGKSDGLDCYCTDCFRKIKRDNKRKNYLPKAVRTPPTFLA